MSNKEEDNCVLISSIRPGVRREFEFAIRSQSENYNFNGRTRAQSKTSKTSGENEKKIDLSLENVLMESSVSRDKEESKSGVVDPRHERVSKVKSKSASQISRSVSKRAKRNCNEDDESAEKTVLMKIFPTKLKELLDTGLLEGLPVRYIRRSKVKEIEEKCLDGVIRGPGILCYCENCGGNEVITPTQFEVHAGSFNKHPPKYIYLDNDRTLRDVLNICKTVPVDELEEAILEAIGCSSVVKPTFCLNCKGSIPEFGYGKSMILCNSCMDLKEPGYKPQPPPQPQPQTQSPPQSQVQTEFQTEPQTHFQFQTQQQPQVQTLLQFQTEPQPHIQLQPQSQAQTQFRSQTMSQTQFQVQSQPQLEDQFQTLLQFQTEPQPQIQSQPQSQAQTEFQFQFQTKSQTQFQFQSQQHLEEQFQTLLQFQTEPQPQIQPKPQSQAQTQFQFQTKSQTQFQFQSQPQLEDQFQTEPQSPFQFWTQQQPQTTALFQPQTQTQFQTHAQAQAQTQAEPQPHPWSQNEPELETKSQPQLQPQSQTQAETKTQTQTESRSQRSLTPLNDGSSRSPSFLSAPKAKCNSSTRKSHSKGQGRLTRKDLGLHKLVFEGDVLPDESPLFYVSHGKKLLEGYKKGSGIFCYCCNTEVSPSQFEAHAGCASRRNPYFYIHTSDGISLHRLSLILSKDRKISIEDNDDLCSICADGGQLLCCDNCPRVFHPECISETVPEDEETWYCRYCKNIFQKDKFNERNVNTLAVEGVAVTEPIENITKRCTLVCETPKAKNSKVPGRIDVLSCVLCRAHDYSTHGFGPKTVIICDQCEKEYHVGCLKKHNMDKLKTLPQGNWFCSVACKGIQTSLHSMVVGDAELLSDTLLSVIKKKHMELGIKINEDLQVKWRLLSGKMASHETRVLLSKAVAIFHERFDPINDPTTSHIDLIPSMVYGRKSTEQEFGGMYCAILTVNSIVVSAGIFRIFGEDLAELPLVATLHKRQGLGYFQALFSCIEELLASLHVKKLLVPSASEAESIWTNKFGFKKMAEEELNRYRSCHHLMVFQGTSMLHKTVNNS